MIIEPETITPTSHGLQSEKGPVPLVGVSVEAQIREGSARTTLTQRYRNVEDEPLETVYTFPIDEGAAVCGFEAFVDGRRIVAEVQEREEAFETYDRAMSEGHGAYLLDQARPDVFVASVGNLMPGCEVELRIVLLCDLAIEGKGAGKGTGEGYRYVLPTTVAPRYAPESDRQGVGEAPAQILNPPTQEDVSYGLSLDLDVQLAGELRGVESPSHPIGCDLDEGKARVYLSQEEAALDRDFVLLLHLAAPHQPRVLVEQGEASGSTVSVTFVPELADAQAPCECIFVVDCSGSMGGPSIASAKEALQLCLRSLLPGSSFNVVAFGSSYELCFKKSIAYGEDSLARASAWVEKLDADLGGTEILSPLTHVLESRPASSLPRQLFVLTDGEVSNTAAVLDLVAGHAATTRCFSFGVGHGPSHHLVRGIARAGRGAAEFILPSERAASKVMRQLARALAPAISGVVVDWGGAQVEQSPETVPPVFRDEAVRIYARIPGELPRQVSLRGETADGPVSFDVEVCADTPAPGNLLQTLWARERIRELEEPPHIGKAARGSKQRGRRKTSKAKSEEKSREEIVQLAVEYGLSSRETSFVAVEYRENPSEEEAELRRVPIALTHGWGEGRSVGRLRSLLSMTMSSPPTGASMSSEPDFAGSTSYDAPPGFDDGETRFLHASLDAPASSSQDSLGDSKPPASNSPMLELILLQHADGHWELDKVLAKHLDLALEDLVRRLAELAELPGDLAAEIKSCWATTLALVFLETRHAEDRDEWGLVAAKARIWLAAATLPDLSLEQLREHAEEVIGGE
jgi:hypothetical protein